VVVDLSGDAARVRELWLLGDNTLDGTGLRTTCRAGD
jgi:hypothetical protein